LEGSDVLATRAALERLGARIRKTAPGCWSVIGVGRRGWRQPDAPLDFGNSGTGVRLVMGAVASTPIAVTFKGDASLSRRPMGRVLQPLRLIGIETGDRGSAGPEDHLPVSLKGAARPQAITYHVPIPSAQVKSAILLAGLNVPGETCVIEAAPTRDHTERMLRAFGVDLVEDMTPEGHVRICLAGRRGLSACRIEVPGDPSSAAFMAVAALIVPGSEVTITDVLMNPLRTGLYQSLAEMGAEITYTNRRSLSGEPVADLCLRAGTLKGVKIPAERAPSMIDEYPILAVAAAYARGTTVLSGLAELRVKESDRLRAMAAGLAACGIRVEEGADSLIVHGCGTDDGLGTVPGGAQISTHHDHRIAMSFLVMGLAARQPVSVDGAAMIETSFPGFQDMMTTLGADLRGGSEGARL